MSRKIVQNNEFFLITRNVGKRLGIFDDKKIRAYFIKCGINQNTWDGWRRRGEIPANGKIKISEILGEGTPLAGYPSDENLGPEGNEMRIKFLVQTAEQILRSSTPFSAALAGNIEAFAVGINLMKKEEEGCPLEIDEEVER